MVINNKSIEILTPSQCVNAGYWTAAQLAEHTAWVGGRDAIPDRSHKMHPASYYHCVFVDGQYLGCIYQNPNKKTYAKAVKKFKL